MNNWDFQLNLEVLRSKPINRDPCNDVKAMHRDGFISLLIAGESYEEALKIVNDYIRCNGMYPGV